ncbi:MAG: DUF932 domain-containing protein [Sandaracinaceae bacterium]|nr:DUF932 domain-containing protein [Sandaracinaceae bacterium]
MTATAPEQAAQLSAALRPRPDQGERWIAHTRPVPFEEAAQHVLDAHAEDGERDDVVAHDLRTWAFGSNDGRTMQLAPVPLPGRPSSEPIALRDLAFTQLAQRIGAPPSYVRTLPGRLQMACMNYGLTQTKQPALLRLAGGEIRAVVSDRYAAIDDELLLDVVGEVLARAGYLSEACVRASAVGAHTLLRVTLPGESVAVKPGDVIEHGLDIGNSEVGLRSVQVTPITYRLICTNGMRAWRSEAAVRMRHVGDPKRLKVQLRDAVPVAFAEARGDIERWRRATEVLIDNALDEVEGLRAFGLGQAEVQAVGRQIMESGALLPASTGNETLTQLLSVPTTAYDMANAITATARDRTDVASRLTLEETAHRYLTRRTA